MSVELATAYVSILPDTSKVAPGMRRALGGVGTMGDQAGRSFGSRFAQRAGMVVRRAAQVGTIAAAAGFVALGTAAVKSATNIDRSRRTLTGLYGSAEDAADIMDRLRRVASTSPIDYAAYTKGAEQLAYMGYRGEEAEEILGNVGAAITAAGGDSQSMGRATDAMLQMVNSGKVYAAQLNQISATGIPIFSSLASHFNTNIENVREMVTAGEVGIEDVMASIQNAEGETFQQMKDAAAETSQSLTDQFKIAKDNIVTTLGTMMEPVIASLAPQVGRLGDLIASGIGSLPDIFDRVRSAVTSGPVADVLSSIAGALSRMWSAATQLVSPVRDVASALRPFAELAIGAAVGAVMVAFEGLAIAAELVSGAVQRVGDFARNHTTTFQVLAGVVAGGAVAFATYRVVMGVAAAATRVWTAVTQGAAVAQRVLNAAMRANPIGLIITALMLLVGGLVLAYNRSETFRNIVQTAFSAVAAAGTWLWESVLKPAFDGIKAAFNAVASAAIWLWENAIRPAFNFITTAGKLLVAVIATLVVGPIILAFRAFGAIASWLWNNAIRPAFSAIGGIAQWLWRNVIKRVVELVVGYFRMLGAVASWLWSNAIQPAITAVANIFRWLWRNIVQPVFRGIANTIRNVWEGLIRPAFRWIRRGVEGVGAIFTWLRDNVIGPVWDWISDKIRNIWNERIRPAFRVIKDAVASVGDAFAAARDFIGDAWNKVANIVRVPINWVIENVINDGIFKTFNSIADAVGLDLTLGPAKTIKPFGTAASRGETAAGSRVGRGMMPRMAGGGRLAGPGTPTSDSIPLWGSRDEFMVQAKAARKVDYPFLNWINKGNHPFHFPGELPGFSGGGRIYPVGSHNFGRGSAAHGYPAVDWPRASGYRVNAAQAGRVATTNRWGHSYGHHVRVNHGGGLQTLYAHLSRIAASIGQDVVAGTRLGSVGSTGNSTGPHLHFEVLRGGSRIDPMSWLQGAGQGDSSGGFFGWIKDAFKGFQSVLGWAKDKGQAAWDFVENGAGVIRHFIGDKLGDWLSGGPFEGTFGQIARRFPRFIVSKIADAAKSLGEKITDILPGGSGGAKSYARSMLGRYGWGDGQWPPLHELWQRESNWNHTATNPSSGAYGIPQSLPASKMASAGADWRTNPHTQIDWGLNYISGRHRSPSGALSFHDRNNWYDAGLLGPGLPVGPSLAFNGTGSTEGFITADQWRTVEAAAFNSGDVSVRVFIGDRELTDMVRTEISETNRDVRRRVTAGVRR